MSLLKLRKLPALAVAAALIIIAWHAWQRFSPPAPWTEAEYTSLASLWLQQLPPVPADPSNAVADNPLAAEFGHRLFFDARLSANGMISCSSCHQPIRYFTDGLPKGVAIGISKRNTPSIVGTAYSPWLYWDGRRDSLWSQALSPLEDPNEHGSSRLQVLSVIAADPDYRHRYETLFGAPPRLEDAQAVDHAFANVGKSLAAYERLLLPGASRFDDYVRHLEDGGDHLRQDILTANEIRGLRLFIGEARCTECHNGPLLTNNEFHNTGLLSVPGELPDRGRIDGIRLVQDDPFNCLGDFSDDPERSCPELRYARTGVELIGATRTPSLRNIELSAPYNSKGQFAELGGLMEHYQLAPLAMIGHNEAEPLQLSDWELRHLESFLRTLAAPVAAEAKWLAAPE